MYTIFKISIAFVLLVVNQVQSIQEIEGLNLYPEGALEQDVPNHLKGSQGDVSTENQLPMESHDVHGQSPLIGYHTGIQNSPASKGSNTKIQSAKSPKQTAKANSSKGKGHHTKIRSAKSPKQTAKANPSKSKGHRTKIQSAKSPKRTAKANSSKGKGHHTTTKPGKVLITSVKVTHTKPAHSSKPTKETKPPSKGIQKGKKCNISIQECAAGLTCVHQGNTKDLKGICLPKDDLKISTRTRKTKLHNPRPTKNSHKSKNVPKAESSGDFYGSIHSDMSSDGSMLSGLDGSFPTDVAGSVSSDDSATATGDVVVDSAGTLSNAGMIGFLAFFLL